MESSRTTGRTKGFHAYVSGNVQGVYYRKTTVMKANALGLRGWVRNLPDGRVELKCWGSETRLADMLTWTKKGPEGAKDVDFHDPLTKRRRVDAVDVTFLDEPATNVDLGKPFRRRKTPK